MTGTGAAPRGLDGVVATTSAISSILAGTLTYRGIDVEELAKHSTFEETVYLLWHGELPNESELEAFSRELADSRMLPAEVFELLGRVPRDVSTMVSLRTAISALAMYDRDAEDMSWEANRRTGIRLLAGFPTVVAAIEHMRRGQIPAPPDPSLRHAENFLYMLTGRQPEPLHARTMDVALILHADHELNASTFAARIAASTLADMHSAVVAALCTFKGSLHGGANEAVMRTLDKVGSVEQVPTYVKGALDRKERLPGFGHRVYRDGDPRARRLKSMAHRLADETGDRRWYEISTRLEEEVRRYTGLLPNVDFYSASVYTYLDLPRALFTPIFAVSRAAGWIAHILEQYENNRLIRPRAEYVGPAQRAYIPMSLR